MMKKIASLLLLFPLMAFGNPVVVPAGENADQDSAMQLRQLLDQTSTLKGEFVQTLFDSDGKVLEESSGDFVLKRPGKFYWNTVQPYEQLLVSDQQTIWLYDPDLEQVTLRSFEDDLQQTPALLLSEDINTLREHFTITHQVVDRGREEFLLTALRKDGLFQTLTLVFTGETIERKLSEFHIRDNLGQLTRFVFDQSVANQPVSDSIFQFTPPDGVDVLYD